MIASGNFDMDSLLGANGLGAMGSSNNMQVGIQEAIINGMLMRHETIGSLTQSDRLDWLAALVAVASSDKLSGFWTRCSIS